MARKANNTLLHKAKSSKSDEFYTQLEDIASELSHYTVQFYGKVVYCNCDDPLTSNFAKYFLKNFRELGLRKLYVSCYKKHEHSLFADNDAERACYVEYDGSTETDHFSEEHLHYFAGDGDFRGEESISILKESDVIVTNPPFSLFREFVSQLVRFKKQFLIIGNINAITYKEIFKLIQDNEAWLGVNLGRGISGFIVPDHYELYGTETKIDAHGNRIISPNNCLWLTNLQNPLRNGNIPLVKKYVGHEEHYPKYDNYEGINIDKTQDIPYDYYGVMGVPITFLHKFNPNQFEIIKFRKGNDDKDLSIGGKCPYFRILIRRAQISV